MFFFDIESSALPSVEHIKGCLQRIFALGKGIGASIADVDKPLATDIRTLSYSMFCHHKQKKKTFTILKNQKLKNMRMQEDTDGFSDGDQLAVISFLNHHLLDAFIELVSYSYLPKAKDGSMPVLLGNEIYSRYSGKKHWVFYANLNGEVFVFDSHLTKIRLIDYIADYFSGSSGKDMEISEVCEIATSELSFTQKYAEISSKIESFNELTAGKHEFILGAITFLDFLAWKGLWLQQNENSSLTEVSNLIEDFRRELKELSQNYFSAAAGIPLSSLISISDTIAVFTPKTSTAEVPQLLALHARFAKYVLEQCCSHQYPIRGAISYGEYSTMKNIMIGPGIDECASWHETGNWIGVHLTPTAQIHWDGAKQREEIICSHSVPLKHSYKATYCVRWSISKSEFNEMAFKSRALLPGIAAKYINTQEFLNNNGWKEEVADGQK